MMSVTCVEDHCHVCKIMKFDELGREKYALLVPKISNIVQT